MPASVERSVDRRLFTTLFVYTLDCTILVHFFPYSILAIYTFSCCTFFMLNHFYVDFLYCNLYMLHFFMLHYFHVALFHIAHVALPGYFLVKRFVSIRVKDLEQASFPYQIIGKSNLIWKSNEKLEWQFEQLHSLHKVVNSY